MAAGAGRAGAGLLRAGPRTAAGSGVDVSFRMLEDAWLTSARRAHQERALGAGGGGEARPNAVELELPDGTRTRYSKATRLKVPKGARRAPAHRRRRRLRRRRPSATRRRSARDVRDGYVSRGARAPSTTRTRSRSDQ